MTGRIDPRVKLIQIVVAALCLFRISSPSGVLCEVLLFVGCLLWIRKPFAALRLGVTFVIIDVFYMAVLTWRVPLPVERFAFILHRLCPTVGIALLALATMTVSELIAGLNRLHCPREVTLALAVALRFIPTIRQELRQIRDAARTRGIAFNFWGFLCHPAVMTEYLLVPFLMRSLRVGDELAAAAVTRGIENPAPRTERIPLKLTATDMVYAIVVLGANVTILLHDVL